MANSLTAHNPTITQGLGRRAVLAGIAGVSIVGAGAATALAGSSEPDQVLAAWRSWRALEMECVNLARRHKETWEALPDWVRSPRVLLLIGRPSGTHFFATTVEEIEHFYFNPARPYYPMTGARLAAQEAKRDAKIAELEDVRRQAELEQERSGLTALDKRMDELIDAQDGLERQIEQSPSTSPVSIAAKIDVGFAHSKRDSYFSDLPHCMFAAVVRSVVHELPADMAEALAPIAAKEGTIQQIYAGSPVERRAVS